MASPSVRSPADFDIRETPSARSSSKPSPIPSRPRGSDSHRPWGPFRSIIDQILLDGETAPAKQRHTAAHVFRRIRDEHHYRGG
jgi:hypothetical protein